MLGKYGYASVWDAARMHARAVLGAGLTCTVIMHGSPSALNTVREGQKTRFDARVALLSHGSAYS